MNLAHIAFYLFMGATCRVVLPDLPVVGPLAVSAVWHQYRNDLHDPQEMKMETMTVVAGSGIGWNW